MNGFKIEDPSVKGIYLVVSWEEGDPIPNSDETAKMLVQMTAKAMDTLDKMANGEME